jgi:ribosomal protein S18 acetylase RimI-like enzyme
VRWAELDDQPRLSELDPWPKSSVWKRKIEAHEILVAESDGQIVGSLRFEFIWTTVSFVSYIVVDERHRGKGFSRQMLDFLISELRGRGAPALLSSAQTDDPVAQSWREHLGFKRNGLIENIADEGVGEVVYRILL